MNINKIHEKRDMCIHTADAKEILNERMKQHIRGEDKSYSWKEAHEIIRRKSSLKRTEKNNQVG